VRTGNTTGGQRKPRNKSQLFLFAVFQNIFGSAVGDAVTILNAHNRKSSPTDRRARVVHLTAEGRRLAVSCFERHAKDLEALMSALSQKEKEQLYGSIKKIGLLAAEQLSPQEVTANRTENKPGK
jgi:hypothetical protein